MRASLLAATALAFAAPLAVPAAAQDSADARARIDRLERELRAVQRRVFPGSESGLVQPDVQPATPDARPAASASTPVADLTARIDAIEAQLGRLTGEIEQQGFRQRELLATVARLRADFDARQAPADAAPTGEESPPEATGPAPTVVRPATVPAPSATVPTPRPAAAPSPAPTAAATAARRTAVAAVEVPSTGDAPEDAYIYGYRLWTARFFPEAQVQLQKVIADHPNHRRASFAGNLLGRAYLDNNQPTLAVRAFYDNYRNRPRGERAAESVYYMGVALTRLNRNSDACRTFEEFDRAYGATAGDALKAQVATARGQANC